MSHFARRVPLPVSLVLVLATTLLPLFPAYPLLAQTEPERGDLAQAMLVYHQITDFPEGTNSLGMPVFSADGATGVFVDAPGTGEVATPNRIVTIDVDSRDITEVDAYQPLCFCGAVVDISNDGATVVSTDTVQVRVAAGAGSGRALATLASNEISSLIIAGDGETVFFIVRRDTSLVEDGTLVPRGVWAIDVDGTDLRQVAGAEAVAGAAGVATEQTGCCFHADGHPLDVSDDGGHVVFAAYAGDGEHVFAVDGEGENVRVLKPSLQYALRVAIRGDGATIASDAVPLGASENEIGTILFAGGEEQIYETPPATEYEEPLQLSADGSRLLVSPNGLLIDTGTGDARLLVVSINGLGGSHEAVLTDGLARATMNAEADRFLYAMRTARCADCLNLPEQLATLDIAPADRGDAPVIAEAGIDPAEVVLMRASEATATATVETSHTVLGVGFAALLPGGAVDDNVDRTRSLLDDGQEDDAVAGDGVYTAGAIMHEPNVARDPDTGPRTVRIAAEVEAGDGLRHAMAVDIGTLTVVAP